MFRILKWIRYLTSHTPMYIYRLDCNPRRFQCSCTRQRINDCWRHIRTCDWRKLIMEVKRTHAYLHYIGYLSNVVLLVAMGIGLYMKWVHSGDLAVVLMAFLGLFIFAIATALIYYFSMETFGISLARLWMGCLLGVISFPDVAFYQHDTLHTIAEVMDFLLVASVTASSLWSLAERLFHLITPEARMINKMDTLEMIGFAISAMVTGRDFVSITLLVLALNLTLIGVRTRSYIAVLNLAGLILIGGLVFFPKLLKTSVNPFGMLCFVGRMAVEPVLDIYFSGLTTLERWEPLLKRSAFVQKLLILAVMSFEVTFVVVLSRQMPNHKEWYVVVPIFTAFAIVWLCYHLVFLVTCYQLSNKISDCNATYRSLAEEARNMHRILASKGVRHFSLISQRLVLVSLLSTFVVAFIGWETKTALSISLWMIVIPVEISFMGLLWEMGATLGGTCVGYAVVAPAPYKGLRDGPSQSLTVLPPMEIQELSSRATHILDGIQRFFSYHLIDTYGCDYTSSGLTLDSVESKLKSLFQRDTPDGPRHDTYFVYYSGPVFDNGDWALAGSDRLKLETVLEWWSDTQTDAQSRLILVLDAEHSRHWSRAVRGLSDETVGIQSCQYNAPADPEEGRGFHIGDFTADWVDYNTGDLKRVDWRGKDRRVRATYGVSKCWTDFTFHLPTEQDINQHWDANFPKLTKPLIKVTNFPRIADLFCCCNCLFRCLRRKKMTWLPPVECDTGHGFKLVRS